MGQYARMGAQATGLGTGASRLVFANGLLMEIASPLAKLAVTRWYGWG
jgi:hypothetical protein